MSVIVNGQRDSWRNEIETNSYACLSAVLFLSSWRHTLSHGHTYTYAGSKRSGSERNAVIERGVFSVRQIITQGKTTSFIITQKPACFTGANCVGNDF